MIKKKLVKFESPTSICTKCNKQIGIGNEFEWADWNPVTKIGKMKHVGGNCPSIQNCDCRIGATCIHETGECKNPAEVKIQFKDKNSKNKYRDRDLCKKCADSYINHPQMDVIYPINKQDQGEKEMGLKVKCFECGNTAVKTNLEGKWACEKHLVNESKGSGSIDIHEVVKELKKYISIDDLETISNTREKIKDLSLETIAEEIAEKVSQIEQDRETINQKIDEVEKLFKEQEKKIIPQVIEIKILDKKLNTFGKHKLYPQLIKYISNRKDVFLNGPAGAGKNTAVEQAAKELGERLYVLQLSQLSLKSELTGYKNIVNDNFIPTTFTQAYEQGGIFFADEFDNWAPTVVTSVNMAIANGFYEFQSGTIKRHPDFVFIAAGNTIGLGAEQHYVTSRALSGASRDRFRFLRWPIDEDLEKLYVPEEYRFWVEFVQKCRALNKTHGGPLLITPRATIQGAEDFAMGFTKQEVVDSVLLRNVEAPSFMKGTIQQFIDGKDM